MADSFPITDRTQMRRKAKRATYDRATIHAILDEALIASVAVSIDGQPHVQPMIHRRVGDALILHGLAKNRLLAHLASGAEACINVAIIDALAIARRVEEHSMHYRSATVYGRGVQITDEAEKQRLMEQVFASLVGSGRYRTLPPLPPGYLQGTMLIKVPIEEAVGKVNDDVDTSEGPGGIWSGLLPVNAGFGAPQPDARSQAENAMVPAELIAHSRG